MASWVHFCSAINCEHTQIVSIGFDSTETRIAVGRSNGLIQILNLHSNLFCEMSIRGYGEGLRKVKFYDDRTLISTYLDGTVKIFEAEGSLFQKGDFESGAGAIWDFVVSPKDEAIIIACEDGTVRVHNMIGPFYTLMSILRGPEARVLSCCWGNSKSPKDTTIWASSFDKKIYCWSGFMMKESDNFQEKKASLLPKLTMDCKGSFAWAIATTNSGELITAQSDGKVYIWDMKTSTVKQTIDVSPYDLLTMAIDSKQQSILVAGVEGINYILNKNEKEWMISRHRRHHFHDINTLALSPNYCFSGGVDGILDQLDVASLAIKGKWYPFPHSPAFSFAKLLESPELYENFQMFLLVQYSTWLEIWKISRLTPDTLPPTVLGVSAKDTKVTELPSLVLKLTPHRNEKLPFNIVCSAISPDGSLVACADKHGIKIYSLKTTDLKTLNTKVQVTLLTPPKSTLDYSTIKATKLAFTSNGDKLVIATFDSIIYVLDTKRLSIIATFEEHKVIEPVSGQRKPKVKIFTFECLVISNNGNWLLSSDNNKVINIYNLKTLSHYVTLPVFPKLTTAAAINSSDDEVILVAADKVMRYNIPKRRAYEWESLDTNTPVIGVTFDPGNVSNVVLYTHTNLFLTDLDRSTTLIAPYEKHYLFCDFIGANELFIAEVPWQKSFQRLPPPAYKHIYAT